MIFPITLVMQMFFIFAAAAFAQPPGSLEQRDSVVFARVMPDKKAQLTVTERGIVTLLSENGKKLQKFSLGEVGWPLIVDLSHDGRKLAVSGRTYVEFWDVGLGAKIQSTDRTVGKVARMCFAPDDEILAVVEFIPNIIRAGPLRHDVATFDAASGAERQTSRIFLANKVSSISFSNDGKKLVVSERDFQIFILEIKCDPFEKNAMTELAK